jgi:hypothetical protein
MRWSLFKERQRGKDVWVIRRWRNGKNERLPAKKYRLIKDNYEELVALVKRLNKPIDLREKVDFQHAFINEALLNDYEVELHNSISGDGLVESELT